MFCCVHLNLEPAHLLKYVWLRISVLISLLELWSEPLHTERAMVDINVQLGYEHAAFCEYLLMIEVTTLD